MLRIIVLAIILGMPGGGSLAQVPGKAPGKAAADPVAEVRAALATDNVYALRNQVVPKIYRYSGDERLTELLRGVWQLDEKAYPDLAWRALRDPGVRINFGQLWGQWIRGRPGADKQIAEIRVYVQPFLKHEIPAYRADAMSFIGVFGTDADLDTLSQAVLSDSLIVAASASNAIYSLKGRQSVPILQDLGKRVQDPRIKSLLESLVEQAQKR